MTWADYKAERCHEGSTHKAHPDWDATDYPWEFRRSDGIITVHKMNSPFGGPGAQQRGVEWSMALADKHLPLGQEDQWPLKPDGWGEVDYDKLEELERAWHVADLADRAVAEHAQVASNVAAAAAIIFPTAPDWTGG